MGTLFWLVFTTAIGWAVGRYVPDVPAPFLGAVIGFIIGLVLRVIVAVGASPSDDIIDVIEFFD